jgi:hypothetical protein
VELVGSQGSSADQPGARVSQNDAESVLIREDRVTQIPAGSACGPRLQLGAGGPRPVALPMMPPLPRGGDRYES